MTGSLDREYPDCQTSLASSKCNGEGGRPCESLGGGCRGFMQGRVRTWRGRESWES